MLTYIGAMMTDPFYNSTAWKKTRALKRGNALLARASSTSTVLVESVPRWKSAVRRWPLPRVG